jgi:class 3 adenylate cyclase
MNIADWLRSLGLSDYTQAFLDNHIDEEILLSLTAEDLKDIGVASVGHRRRLMAALEELKHAKEPAKTSDEGRVLPDAVSERREVTVLFADIERFTTLSEMLDAEQVHSILTTFFEHIDGIINGLGGRIDKHIGDCAKGESLLGCNPITPMKDEDRVSARTKALNVLLILIGALSMLTAADLARLRFNRPSASENMPVSTGERFNHHWRWPTNARDAGSCLCWLER